MTNYGKVYLICDQYYKNSTNSVQVVSKEFLIEDAIKQLNGSSKKPYKVFSPSDENDEEEQEIIEIKKFYTKESIIFISANKNLFSSFNLPIQLIQKKKYDDEDFIDFMKDLDDKENSIDFIEDLDDEEYLIDVNMNKVLKDIKYVEFEYTHQYINKILFKYGNIFEIDIKSLVKGTTYLKDYTKFDSYDETRIILYDLILEDIFMLRYKKILTSRLSIVIYRLFFFNLSASTVAIGRFFHDALDIESKSYIFNNLNNNHDGYYFPTLSSMQFKGYKLVQRLFNRPLLYSDKINIAKKLLKSKVKIKIVSEALSIPEGELNEVIYGDNYYSRR